MKPGLVKLSFVPVVAAFLVLSGCTNAGDPDYAGYCVDEYTKLRIEDDRCGDFLEAGESTSSGTFVNWVHVGPDYKPSKFPAVGSPATHGERIKITSNNTKVTTVPKGGGTVSRGGFGVPTGVGAKSAAS